MIQDSRRQLISHQLLYFEDFIHSAAGSESHVMNIGQAFQITANTHSDFCYDF